jgi:hypothetical protein
MNLKMDVLAKRLDTLNVSRPINPANTSGRPATLAYVRWSLHIGPKGVSYVQVLPKGYPKK